MDINSYVTLSNGVAMPRLGLGVWRAGAGQEVYHAVGMALHAGYRMIDTAQNYRNEAGVGRAIKDSAIPRDQIFITTKVENRNQGFNRTLRAYEESLEAMGLDYIDLFLIHWPTGSATIETWRALVKLYEDQRVRAIGVSNFHEHHIEMIVEDSGVAPMVNQVECHPLLTQKPLMDYCHQNNIQFESYSPLMQGRLNIPLLLALSQKYDKTPAQVVIRWHLQRNSVVIPKSVHENRILENAQVFDFTLFEGDMQAIDSLNRNERFLPDPDRNPFAR